MTAHEEARAVTVVRIFIGKLIGISAAELKRACHAHRRFVRSSAPPPASTVARFVIGRARLAGFDAFLNVTLQVSTPACNSQRGHHHEHLDWRELSHRIAKWLERAGR